MTTSIQEKNIWGSHLPTRDRVRDWLVLLPCQNSYDHWAPLKLTSPWEPGLRPPPLHPGAVCLMPAVDSPSLATQVSVPWWLLEDGVHKPCWLIPGATGFPPHLARIHCYPDNAQVGKQRARYGAQKWNPTLLVTQTAILSHVVPANNDAPGQVHLNSVSSSVKWANMVNLYGVRIRWNNGQYLIFCECFKKLDGLTWLIKLLHDVAQGTECYWAHPVQRKPSKFCRYVFWHIFSWGGRVSSFLQILQSVHVPEKIKHSHHWCDTTSQPSCLARPTLSVSSSYIQ